MIDWSEMSEREVYEALRTAPKVAGPWEADPDDPDDDEPARRNGFGDLVARDTDYMGIVICADGVWPQCVCREDADAALRAAGWLLVGDDDGKEPSR